MTDILRHNVANVSDNEPGARVKVRVGEVAPLAEFASCQVELKYLAWATGRARYFWAVSALCLAEHVVALCESGRK
jgi:hypothetical protein